VPRRPRRHAPPWPSRWPPPKASRPERRGTCDVLVAQQNADGSWPSSNWSDNDGVWRAYDNVNGQRQVRLVYYTCGAGNQLYLKGNLYTRRNLQLLRSMIEFMGIEPDRFQMSWVSASEGGKFAEVVKTTVEKVRKLGPNKKFTTEKREGGE
jgi:hypothetical protein